MYVSRVYLICTFFFGGALASFSCDVGYGETYVEVCEECAAGRFGNGTGMCEPCQPNTFQPEGGQADCKACPPGTSSAHGATECLSCPDGQAVMHDNTCGTCAAGTHYTFDEYFWDKYCSECPSGFYKREEGVGPCLPCAKNTYSASGATECIRCPEGQALMANGSCGTCAAGQFYDSSSLQCFLCCPGTYTDGPNILPRCYWCAGNSFSEFGSSQCVECAAGTVFVKDSGSCEVCHAGQFYSYEDVACIDCPYTQFSVRENQKLCDWCSEGTFSRRGSTTCFSCPLGQVYIADEDECGECAQGSVYLRHHAECTSVDEYLGLSLPELPEPPEELFLAESPEFWSVSSLSKSGAPQPDCDYGLF